jgi:uncharacterized membrane-anchored protein
MKKEHIIATQRAICRAMAWHLALVMAACLLMVWGVSCFPDTWRGVPSWFGMSQHQAAVNSLLALFTLGIVGGVFFIGRRHDIRCPKCDRSIQGGVYASLAIATGKCGHCGEVIVDE